MGFSEVIAKKYGSSKLSLNSFKDVDSSSAVFSKKLENTMFNEFRKSKIIVCAYPQTPFFEAMTSGIPTILLCKYKYWKMKKESSEMFNLLKDSQIVFENPLEGSKHVNNYWNDINQWWSSEKTIKTRKFFLENFYNVKKNWHSDWSKFVSEEYEKVFENELVKK